MFRIMDAEYFKDVGNDGFSTAPIGTGSFRVTSWANERMEAVKFADAWRPAKIDRLIINALTETPTRVQALVARPGALGENLLGMSFLERLQSYQVSEDRLILRGAR
jgi:clan AA aspartic protease (TIGR02281 family)